MTHYKYNSESSVKRLIDWAWSNENKEHILDESIRLASIMLSWFLTSTNRALRDSASKGLICLLENRITVLKMLLETFKNVNDPYIYSRLYGVAYGCALRTKQKDQLSDLSYYIYETIFCQEEVYPHILLRDYARGVIKYTIHLGNKLKIDYDKIIPPYSSDLPTSFPSNEEIDSYKFDYQEENFKEYYWSQNTILYSMVTEHGRGTAMYGDFGRYVFQSGFHSWKDILPNNLSNLAVKWIFQKYGYDVEKHGQFDREIALRSYDRAAPIQERIGKKYQWIAFHELLARVADNCDFYEDTWGSKKLSTYNGAWNPYIRDFEPTTLIKKTYYERGANNWWSNLRYNNWDKLNKDWIIQKDDLPCPAQLINVEAPKEEEWLALEIHPEWQQPKPLGEERYDVQHKLLWYQLSKLSSQKK